MQRLASMAALAVGMIACVASPARRDAGAAGTYELSWPCSKSLLCPQGGDLRTLVLLESPAPAHADEMEVYGCSQEQGFRLAGCLVDIGSMPRRIAWNRDGEQIHVAVSCGPDGGDQLLFRRDGSKGVWRTGLCCEVDPSGEITGHFGDTTYALKRVGGPEPERCR